MANQFDFSKFKIGDKVKIIKTKFSREYKVGEILIIKEIDKSDKKQPFRCESKKGKLFWIWYEEFELLEEENTGFQLGDLVKIIEDDEDQDLISKNVYKIYKIDTNDEEQPIGVESIIFNNYDLKQTGYKWPRINNFKLIKQENKKEDEVQVIKNTDKQGDRSGIVISSSRRQQVTTGARPTGNRTSNRISRTRTKESKVSGSVIINGYS